jgi:hypothetical protein
MPAYPIRVPRDSYSGKQARRVRKRQEFNEAAERLERYINDTFEKSGDDSMVFIYGFVAHDLGMTTAQVRDVLFGVDAGHNGLRVFKRKDPSND